MKLYTHTHTHTSNSIKNNRENKWINSQSDSVVCMKNATTGITLVALVITIVVLLILAGITIMYVMSDNGIFKKASDAKLKTDIASWQERLELAKEPVFINGLGIFDPDEYFEYIEHLQHISISENICNHNTNFFLPHPYYMVLAPCPKSSLRKTRHHMFFLAKTPKKMHEK